MIKLWEWIKKNKLSVFLLLILLYIFGGNLISILFGFGGFSMRAGKIRSPQYEQSFSDISGFAPDIEKSILPPKGDYAPSPDMKNRLVIQESFLSLLVKNVRETGDKIIENAKNNGGYMVHSSFENPGESPSGSVIVRIPAKNLTSVLEFFRSLSIKVVSESLIGEDVTDQYVDIQARLETLNKTKVKFEDMLDKAINVQDILIVQKELINLQSQIDSLKGQQQYLEKSAQMAKLTIYLSTDELALPYAPSETWRPEIIFKLAIRSLIGTLRNLGSLLIWIGVYSVIWVPVLLIIYFLKKRSTR